MCRNGGWGGGPSFALYAPFSHRVRGPMVGPQQAMPNLPGGHWDPTPGQPPRHENCQQGVYAVSIGINAAARRTASTTATGFIHFFKTHAVFFIFSKNWSTPKMSSSNMNELSCSEILCSLWKNSTGRRSRKWWNPEIEQQQHSGSSARTSPSAAHPSTRPNPEQQPQTVGGAAGSREDPVESVVFLWIPRCSYAPTNFHIWKKNTMP